MQYYFNFSPSLYKGKIKISIFPSGMDTPKLLYIFIGFYTTSPNSEFVCWEGSLRGIEIGGILLK